MYIYNIFKNNYFYLLIKIKFIFQEMAEIEMVDKTKIDKIEEGLNEMKKEILENESREDTSLQQEKKTYINLYFCQITVGIIFAYLYIAISILMNVINRVIFHTYLFRFNFTILFCQQFFCLLTFAIVSKTSKQYQNKVGEISFQDFSKLKKNYITFSLIFILNNITGFVGSQ